MNRISFIILLILFRLSAFSQISVDSLKTLLSSASNDTTYVDILNKLSKSLRYSDVIQATDYAVKAEKLASEIKYKDGLALAFHNIGSIYTEKQNNELALEYFRKSVELNLDLNNKKALADCYDNMGLLFRRNRDFSKSLEYHNLSLDIKRKIGDTIGISYSNENMGIIFLEQGKYDLALVQFYNSLRIKESVNDKYGMANSHGNIGIVYLKIGSLENARINFERSLQLFEFINNLSGIAGSLFYLSDIYFQEGNLVKAEEVIFRSLDISRAKGDIQEMAAAYLQLGEIYEKKGNQYKGYLEFKKSLEHYQLCNNEQGIVKAKIKIGNYYFKSNQPSEAIEELKFALGLAKKNQLLEEEYNVLNLMAEVYLKQEQFEPSAESYQKVRRISDSLFNVRLFARLSQMEMRYEFDKKMREVDFEKKQMEQEHHKKVVQNRLERWLFASILAFVILFVVLLSSNLWIIRKKNRELAFKQTTIEEHIQVLKKQKEALEKANMTKNRFMSIIGHDLRTPFNAINGITSLVVENYDSLDKTHINRYLCMLKEAGENAQGLLDNILQWALSQSGELSLNPQPISIVALLKGNVMLLEQLVTQKEISIVEKYEEDLVAMLDKNMINTVLRNLLSNALKFTNPGGSITIEAFRTNNFVKISIEDTGIGISPTEMERILSNDPAKRIMDGRVNSGLGLVLCRDFLEQHNQKLNIESTPGKGSRFWFILPLIPSNFLS